MGIGRRNGRLRGAESARSAEGRRGGAKVKNAKEVKEENEILGFTVVREVIRRGRRRASVEARQGAATK